MRVYFTKDEWYLWFETLPHDSYDYADLTEKELAVVRKANDLMIVAQRIINKAIKR